MFAYLRGTVRVIEEGALIVLTESLGFRVFVTASYAQSLHAGETVELYLHHAVSDQQQSLYGFPSHDVLRVFELLIRMNGVGPKSALLVLNKATLSEIKHAVVSQDSLYLHKVCGLGKKIAERIVLGLRDKGELLESVSDSKTKHVSVDGDVSEALRGLGYSPEEIRHTLHAIPRDVQRVEERLSEALKMLSKSSKA